MDVRCIPNIYLNTELTLQRASLSLPVLFYITEEVMLKGPLASGREDDDEESTRRRFCERRSFRSIPTRVIHIP